MRTSVTDQAHVGVTYETCIRELKEVRKSSEESVLRWKIKCQPLLGV
jgi:hypothetical protein